MPELMRDNLDTRYDTDGEIHPAEAVEEQISLSERFGLWLSFYPFRQDDYLDIVAHWLQRFGLNSQEAAEARAEALQFALQRGSRSGRVALQFARHWAGTKRLAIGSHSIHRRSTVDVAAGVLIRPDGMFLLQPPCRKAYPPTGFPEESRAAEDLQDACARFAEELASISGTAYPGVLF